MRAPDITIRVIDVSFGVLPDKAERDYLNTLPTSFVLDDERWTVCAWRQRTRYSPLPR